MILTCLFVIIQLKADKDISFMLADTSLTDSKVKQSADKKENKKAEHTQAKRTEQKIKKKEKPMVAVDPTKKKKKKGDEAAKVR